MTPKERASELISRFISIQDDWYLDNLVDGLRIAQAKKSATYLVNQQIKDEKPYEFGHPILVGKRIDFLNEVLKEIELT